MILKFENLEINIVNFQDEVYFHVINQNESMTNKSPDSQITWLPRDDKHFQIASSAYPYLSSSTIFLRGRLKEENNLTTRRNFEHGFEADKYYNKLIETFLFWSNLSNNKLIGVETSSATISFEDISISIAHVNKTLYGRINYQKGKLHPDKNKPRRLFTGNDGLNIDMAFFPEFSPSTFYVLGTDNINSKQRKVIIPSTHFIDKTECRNYYLKLIKAIFDWGIKDKMKLLEVRL